MQTDSLQKDTTIPAAGENALATDTALPVMVRDTEASASDSVKKTKKEDSLSSAVIKQPETKKSIADTSSAIKKNAVPDSVDFLMKQTDSGIPDTLRVAHQPDTIVSELVQKDSEDMLPVHLRLIENNNWAVALFIALFGILAWLKSGYSRRLRQFFTAFLSNRYIRQLVREEFVFSHPSSIALSSVFLCTAAFLLTRADYYFNWQLFAKAGSAYDAGGMVVFLKILVFLLLFYLVKILVIRLSAVLFNAAAELTEYLFNLFLFNNMLGVILLPFALGVAFANAFSPRHILLFSGGLVLLSFLFRLVKYVYTGRASTNFSMLYIILYICTLEILPIFIVIKAFTVKN